MKCSTAVSLLLVSCLFLEVEGAPAVQTGESWKQVARFGDSEEMVYYIRDTGDGRWLAGARGIASYPAPAEVRWHRPGTYETRWIGVSLSGEIKRGTKQSVAVQGQEQAMGKALKISTEGLGGLESADPYLSGSVFIRLDGLKRLDWIVLQPGGDIGFPADFSVQTSPDNGAHWHRVMSAEFVHFPDPDKKQVWIPLNGVAATALRIFVARGNPLPDGGYGWSLGGITVYGDEDFPWRLTGSDDLNQAAWNNLWLNFGLAANEVHERYDPWWETQRPLDGGMLAMGSTLWYYWNALKLGWMGPSPDLERLKDFLTVIEVGEDGYVWVAPGHEFHLGHSRHYGTNAIYIRAVAYYYLLSRDKTFIERKDPRTNESILEKARRAMRYQLEELEGENGLLVLDDPKHDGTAASMGSNYWDFWLFGYLSAYDNALFYDSLRLMAQLEASLGNVARAAALNELRAYVKTRYNETFWDPERGRYIGWEDVNGERYDYGFTDVNLMALAFGLADEEKAQRVLAWLDGTRTVAGDDAGDIYHFGFAPRSTTVDAYRGNPPVVNTWGGELDIRPGENASYGKQIQNGGAIFVVSYHDLHARRRWQGAEDVEKRWTGILREFSADALRRDMGNFRGHADVVGILREFPESGLVPYFFVDGIMGLSPAAEGLRIAPSLPERYPSARVNGFHYAGSVYDIIADRALKAPVVGDGIVRVPAGGAFILSPEGKIHMPGTTPGDKEDKHEDL